MVSPWNMTLPELIGQPAPATEACELDVMPVEVATPVSATSCLNGGHSVVRTAPSSS